MATFTIVFLRRKKKAHNHCMTDIQNYDLTRHNTFGISAMCRRFVEFSSVEELRLLLRSLSDADRPFLVMGGGSNLLFTGDYRGTVLHSAIRGIEAADFGDQVLLRVGSGENWDAFVECCVQNGWHGAENLSLIPGEVGASAVQNIGAYGVEASDIIHKVEAVAIADGSAVEFAASDCGYGYRMSKFKREWLGQYVVTHVTYRLDKRFSPRLDYGGICQELHRQGIDSPTPVQLRQAIIDIRQAKLPDPQVIGSAGSFFKNPLVSREAYEELAVRFPSMPHYDAGNGCIKLSAGWMIENCGWRGRRLGAAGVYSGQALVLVNLGGATGQDVVRLANAVSSDVESAFGVRLEPEVNIL